MKCDVCGVESDFEKAFTKQHRSWHRSDLRLCPRCFASYHQNSEANWQILIVVLGIAGYGLLYYIPDSPLGRFLTAFFLFDLFLTLSIVPHEFGHAIAGRLVGWRVFAVVVGMGRRAFKFNRYGILFSFHWLPIGGATILTPMDACWYRTKSFLTTLAGPAANLIIAGLIFVIWRSSWQELGFFGGVPRVARICFIANLFVLAVNLWPHRTKITKRNTDGKLLIKVFSRKEKKLEELLAARYVLEATMLRDEHKDYVGAAEWVEKGLAHFPNNFNLLNLRGVLSLDWGKDYGHAREAFLKLLPAETGAKGKRYIILNNIAYADALAADPELLPEADAFSKEAYGGAPWIASITGTRGTVLVEMGQMEEGIKLLKEAFEKHDVARGKALNACHLSIAYARLKDLDQADKYLKLARQFDPQCVLLERTERELAVAK